jgi:hypothetical protein
MCSYRTLLTAMCLAITFASDAAGQSLRAESSQKSEADLRRLTADLAAQLRLVYRDDLPEYARRHAQLRAAILAWNASPQSDADRRQMADWLRNAIRNSMPGAAEPMPSIPASEGDPFRDDPLP